MGISLRHVSLPAACAAVSLLVACGGGGGGGGTVSSTPVANTNLLATTFTDTFGAQQLLGNFGVWSGDGGGSDGGTSDAGGSAGDGEYIEVSTQFNAAGTGKLRWYVRRSQYGLDGTSGQMDLTKDVGTVGGYKVTAVNGAAPRSTQSNIFVSGAGQVTGTLPLATGSGGSVKDVNFAAVRFLDAQASSTAAPFQDYAGDYGFAGIAAVIRTGASPDTKGGVLRIDAQGSGRICTGVFTFAANCPDGIDFVASYVDSTTRNQIQLNTAATQSQPISAGSATGINVLGVLRSFTSSGNSGRSLIGDIILTGDSEGTKTGAIYASRLAGSAVTTSQLDGAWNYSVRIISGTSVGNKNVTVAFKTTNGVTKALGVSSGNCSAPLTSLLTVSNAGGVPNGAVTLTATDNTVSYAFLLDTDLAVSFTPGEELGLVRKYSNDSTKANNCL